MKILCFLIGHKFTSVNAATWHRDRSCLRCGETFRWGEQ